VLPAAKEQIGLCSAISEDRCMSVLGGATGWLTAGCSVDWVTMCVGTVRPRHLNERDALGRSSPMKNQ
jgi:hypothetical protein